MNRHTPVPRFLARLACTAALLGASALSAEAQVVRGFTSRFATTARGDVYLTGNTVQTCNASASGCTNARAGTGTTLNNNDFTMIQVDVDAVDPGANSSSADLAIPGTATVTWAGLYWGARSTVASRNQVRLRVPGSGTYTTVTASQVDTYSTDFYSAFANVTSLVQAGGNGTYTVANVQAIVGTNTFAGWSLVVVTADATQPPRNMVVFDGYANVSGTSVTINVSGFVTPPSGTVNTRLGAVIQEGDLGLTGDAMRLNTTTLSDALNPATNFFNSSITRLGTRLSAKNPDYVNQLGFGVDVVNASGILPNAATSATITLSTSGDQYLPQAISFATEVFEPVLQPNSVKSVTDLNGGYVAPGDILEYTIPFANTGNDHADAIVLRDVIPANTTYVPGSLVVLSGANAGAKSDASGDDQAEYDGGNNRVVFRVGTGANAASGGSLAPGESSSIRFRVQIGAAVPNGTVVSNVASLAFTGRTLGVNYNLNTNTVATTVNLPDLTVAKTHSGDFVRGSSGVYSIVASNVGFGPTSGLVTVSDTLPAGLTPTAASGSGWSCSVVAPTVTCTRSDVLAAGASYPAISLTVSVSQAAASPRLNTAAVSGGSQQNLANDSSTDSTTVVSSADLSMAKSGPPTITAGTNVVYTTVVTNHGPSDASSVVVADPTPAGLSFVGNAGDCATPFPCAIGTVPAGATRTITSTYSLPASYAGSGPILNTASVSSATPDPLPANDSAGASSSVARSADLQVAKSGTASVAPGNAVVYSVTVTNLGPSDASGVVVADPTPAGLVFVSNSGDCTGSFPCALGTVPAGAARTITATFSVPSAYSGPEPIVNTASAAATTSDPSPANDSASASTTVARSADLVISKAGPASAVPGAPLVYTITATNNGPSDAAAVVIDDPTPAGLGFVSNTGNCTTAFPCAMGTIPAGATRVITTTFSVPASYTAPDPVSNTATIASTTPEAAPGNEDSTATTPLAASADVSIGKSGPAVLTPGTTAVFTIQVVNHGPSDATGVSVDDPTPSGLAFLSTSGDCATAFPCSLGTIPAGGVRTITASYSIPSSYTSPDPIENMTTVSTATSDPDPADNAATTSSAVQAVAALSVVKTGPPTVSPGTDVTYAITVRNHGPSDATGVDLTDATPPGLTFVSNAGDCATPFPCDLATVPAGASRTVLATFSIPPSYTTPDPVLNTAEVASDVFDPALDNNSSTAASAVAAAAGLSISKTGPAVVVPGRNVVYTTTVTNHGPSVATNTAVADPTPAGLTFVSNELDCTTAFPCALGTVPVGESRVIRSTFFVPSSYSAPDPLSNSATATSDVSAPVVATHDADVEPRANLSIRKVGPPTLTPGLDVTFVITVANLGESDAPGVVIDDATPAGLVFQSNAGDCATAFPCALGTVPAGETREVLSTYAVPADYAGPDPVVNVATVASSIPDPVPVNNENSATASLNRLADLRVAKAGPDAATPGIDVVYTITLTNDGPSDADAVELADATPAGLVFLSNAGDCVTPFPCSFGTVPAGATRTVTATFSVPSGYTAPDSITNSATASSSTTDPTPGNDTSTINSSPVTPLADLVITKTGPATATAGGDIAWQVTVTNNGPSDATSVAVVDPTPTGLVFVSNAGDCATAFPCDLGTLVAGESRTFTSTFTVPADYSGPDPIENTALLQTPTADPSPGDESATASANLLRRADLTATKTGPAGVTPGQDSVWTIVVTNDGPSDAADVEVTDPAPPGLAFVSNAGDCTTGFPCALGTIPAGASRTITTTFSVPTSYAGPDPVQNTATVTSTVVDPAPGGESSTAAAPVSVQADLSISKSGPTAVVPGSPAVFILTVTNDGPSDAPAVVVSDPTPPGLVFASNTGDCATTFPCALGAIEAGGTRTIVATWNVPASYLAPDPVQNVATVSSSAGDPSPGNESSTVLVPVEPSASVKITKSGPASVVPGTPAVYTLSVRNDGPSDALAVVIDDQAPPGLAFVSNSGDCTTAFPCAVGTMAAGTSRTITATFDVDPAYTTPDPLRNFASATTATFDPAEETNTSFADSAVTPSANLSITKSGPATFTPGGTVTYTVVVTNLGSSDAAGVVVADATPTGLTFVSNSGACTSAYPCAIGAVPAGQARTITSTYSVAPVYTGANPLVNTASVSSSTPDPNTTNNSNSASSNAVGNVSGVVWLDSDGDAARDAGEVGISGVTVTITGPSCPGPAGCATTTAADGSYSFVNLAFGNYTVVETDPPGYDSTTPNSVVVAVGLSAARADFGDVLSGSLGDADLAMAKTHSGTFETCSDAAFLLRVQNLGPTASGGPITVIDTLPAGTAYVSASGTGWTCSASGQVVTCQTFASLAPGAWSSAIQLTVALSEPAFPTVNNTATVYGLSDPNPVNDAASHGVTVRAGDCESGPETCRVALRKVHSGNMNPGGEILYSLQWSNSCRNDLADVVVQDPLPPGLTALSAESNDASASIVGDTVTFATNVFKGGSVGKGSITARIDDDAVAGSSIRNVATFGDGAGRTAEGRSFFRVRGGSTESGRLSCFVRAQVWTRPGRHVKYEVRYKNGSSDNALQLTLPDELEIDSAYPLPDSQDGNTLYWTSLAATSGKVTVNTRVDVATADQVALVGSALMDDGAGQAAVCEHSSVVRRYGNLFAAIKANSHSRPGLNVRYLARYREVLGHNQMTVSLPDEVTVLRAFPPPSGGSGKTLVWNDLPLPSGSVKIDATVGPVADGVVLTAAMTMTDETTDVVTSQCQTVIGPAKDTGSTSPSGLAVDLGVLRSVSAGTTTDLTLRYSGLVSAGSALVTLPPELTPVLAVPSATFSGDTVIWNDLAPGSGSRKVRVAVSSAARSGAVLALTATVTDSEGATVSDRASTLVRTKSGDDTSAELGMTLSVARSVTPGLTTDVFADWDGLVGTARLAITLPAGMTVQSTVPAGATVSGQEILWPALTGATGSVRARVLVSPSVASGTVLSLSAAVSSDSDQSAGAAATTEAR